MEFDFSVYRFTYSIVALVIVLHPEVSDPLLELQGILDLCSAIAHVHHMPPPHPSSPRSSRQQLVQAYS